MEVGFEALDQTRVLPVTTTWGRFHSEALPVGPRSVFRVKKGLATAVLWVGLWVRPRQISVTH